MKQKWILWVALVLLWGGWISFGLMNKEQLIIYNEQRTSSTEPIPNHLSLIPTSPRWKPLNSNHNVFYNSKGKLSFPESTLPIVAISIKEEAFFDYFNGIYIRGVREWEAQMPEIPWWFWPANYRNRGKKWEREAQLTFEGFGNDRLVQICGIRINGNATRGFPQKSLRLVFKEKYGRQGIKNVFFTDLTNVNFITMILRNGGNDWDRGFMRDVLVSVMSENLEVETQPFAPVSVYLNGEYWGIHYLRPKVDQDFLAGKYNIRSDSISMIESPGKIYRGTASGLNEFNDLLVFSEENDLSDSTIFSYVRGQMDMANFIDYLCVNMIVVNTDWPQNNWLVWKNQDRSGTNRKWRWVIKDTDYGLGFFNQAAFSYDMIKKVGNDQGSIGILFRNFLENESFKTLFQLRFKQIISYNWSVKYFNTVINRLQTNISSEMPYQINRWRTHKSLSDWKNEVDQIRVFYSKRNAFLLTRE
jgi:hypothetical protein